MELKSSDLQIRALLATSYFEIPRFQRPYSWSKDNVDELWEDLDRNQGDEYFIGSMVVYPDSTGQRLSVIDGQQRLTTLLMLLAAIRTKSAEFGLKKLEDGTQGLIERPDENSDLQFVLTAQATYPFLQDVVFAKGASELPPTSGHEQEAIEAAYERLLAHVDEAIDEVAGEDPKLTAATLKAIEAKLREIRECVLGIRVILITVGNQDDATVIFVTLNSRGRDLEPADLIKAHLLTLMPRTGGLDRPLEKWDQMSRLFDESAAGIDPSDFLRVQWIATRGRASKADLAKQVRSQIDAGSAEAYLDALLRDAAIFRQIHEPGYRRWKEAEREIPASLKYFKQFSISIAMPLIMSLIRAFDEKRLTVGSLTRGLRAIEDYHFAWNTLAGRSSSGGMSSFYGRWAKTISDCESKTDAGQATSGFVKELLAKRPTRDEFTEALHDLRVGHGQSVGKQKAKHLLTRLYSKESPTAALDMSLTIEHLKNLSDGNELEQTIGNLILVTKELNGQLGNKTFPKKREILESANEWVPGEVLSAKRWTVKQISDRTVRIVDEAIEFWNIPESQPESET